MGGDTPEAPNGDPTLVEPAPRDALDTAFYFHDWAYQQTPGATILPQADFTLLQTIDDLDLNDPEAILYAGFASLSIIGQLVSSQDALAQLTLEQLASLPGYTLDAVQDLEAGLAAAPSEGRSLHGALHVFEAKFLPRSVLTPARGTVRTLGVEV